MKKRTVSTNELTPNKVFLVRGKLTFSRLAAQLEGEDLVRDNERRRTRGAMPINRPYTSATVCEARVQRITEGEATPEETYAEESLYDSKTGAYSGKLYTGTNKTKFLPFVVVQRKGEDIADRIELEQDLAPDQEVTMVMRVFKSPNGNNGISLDGLILHEIPVRYRSENTARRDFKTLNIAELAMGQVG